MISDGDICDVDFDADDVAKHTVGAGILPVARREDGKLCMLLGKERYVPRWKGSLKWSAFEGGRQSGESVEDAAAREFYEETAGTLALGERGEFKTCDEIARMLCDDKYCCKVVMRMRSSREPQYRYRVTYLVHVPFSPRAPMAFHAKRQLLLLESESAAREVYLEKQCVRWWHLDELRTVMLNRGVANNDFFRAYFLPVMYRCIEELCGQSPSTRPLRTRSPSARPQSCSSPSFYSPSSST
jgi:8-oxo-dGTP pyrophosphatase MutT (NUDIX family)